MASFVSRLLRNRSLDQISSTAFAFSFSRCLFSSSASCAQPFRATLFPGDGIGPEIADSVKQGMDDCGKVEDGDGSGKEELKDA
ncbi:hypothetical protein ACLOJK_037148 [Asimina triloba]